MNEINNYVKCSVVYHYLENWPDLESGLGAPGGTGPNGSKRAPGGTAPLLDKKKASFVNWFSRVKQLTQLWHGLTP